MKRLIIILSALFLLTVSVFSQDELPRIKAGKNYKQNGVKLISPNQPDWQIVKSKNLETSFTKTDANGKYKAFVKTKTMNAFENVKDLFIYLEKLKQEEISGLDRDSLHFNRTNFKETPCLQYDGIFDNTAKADYSSYKYFNLYGYLCQHPTAKNTLIEVEFSNYSNSRGFSEAETKLSRDFFEKIEFVKVKNKK